MLAADVRVKGDIVAEADLNLEGHVEGDVTVKGLVQGQGSVVKGAIRAETARLAGTVEGAVDVKELVIEASARITGDVSYDSLTIAPGAKVEGRFSPRAAAPRVELVASA